MHLPQDKISTWLRPSPSSCPFSNVTTQSGQPAHPEQNCSRPSPPPQPCPCFPNPFGGSDGKASACNAGDPGSTPGLGRSPGEGNGNPLQYSCLKNSMDRGARWATVHGSQGRTWLSDFTSLHLALIYFPLLCKLKYFGHLMQRAHSLEKTLILGKIEGK